jgi:putative ABC transport system substrate-binding protein
MRPGRVVSATLVSGLLVLSALLLAQRPTKIWRVGFLATRGRPASLDTDAYGGCPKALRKLDYIEGQNLEIEWRFADNKPGRFREHAAELVTLHVDVIVTDGTPPTIAAKNATKTIPIVVANAGDPVGTGLVKTLARPGGNVTGVSLLLVETTAKEVEMLLMMAPKTSRIAALWNPGNQSNPQIIASLQAAVRKVNVDLLLLDVRNAQEIADAFPRMSRVGVDAVFVQRDQLLTEHLREIAELAERRRLPSIAGVNLYPEAGGLVSYGVNSFENWHRVATLVDKIFKGADPAELPMEQPTKLELVINRNTAKALGLAIPPELLLLADKVIE